MKHVKTFENFLNESLNEGKMTINPMMDKSVKTPWGKGGAAQTVILGKTSSGLAVTLNGDFVDAKKNVYVTDPSEDDRKEAMEMIKFHHDRLTGGTAKEKLASLLANGIVKEELNIKQNESEITGKDAEVGDSALVKSENKMGVIMKIQGGKFTLKFVDGSSKVYSESELQFIMSEDEKHPYFKGISKSTEQKKKAQMADQAAAADDDPEAYKELPGDTKGKKQLKTSKHTKKYQELYGDK